MAAGVSNLYQSGEKVTASGIFQLVETTTAGEAGTVLTLRRGEFFPDHRGRAACWYLVRTIPERKATAPLHTPWQSDPDQVG